MKFRMSPGLLDMEKKVEALSSIGKYKEGKRQRAKFLKLKKVEKKEWRV